MTSTSNAPRARVPRREKNDYSPEAAGDYLAGPNHVLPTAGTARFSGPLSVEDFQQRSSLLHLAPAALAAWREPITSLARLEGLEAHARSILTRTEP